MRHAFLTTILLSSSAWAQSRDCNTDGEADVTGVLDRTVLRKWKLWSCLTGPASAR